MPHILEVYAKDLGVKATGKPEMQKHFYPNTLEKYITLHCDTKIQSKQYDYWDVVLNIVKPFLNQNQIKIVQTGSADLTKINGVDKVFIVNKKNLNYLISKSLLHVGIDSMPVHIASAFSKKIVALYSHTYKETCYPYWSSEKDAITLSPDFSEKKPSFSNQEHQKRINEIKPELIAQSILDQLNIKEKVKFKTIKIGNDFHHENVEIVPNFNGLATELKDKGINLRADLHFDIQAIINWCRFSLVSLHIKNEIPVETLKLMTKLKQVVFKYTKEIHNTDLNKFFKILKSYKINILIICDDKDIIPEVRLKYFDYNVVQINYPKNEIKASKFLSKKKFITNGNIFPSESSANRLDKTNNFVYDDFSSKELEYLYLYDE